MPLTRIGPETDNGNITEEGPKPQRVLRPR